MRYLNFCLVCFCCLITTTLFAQTPQQIETDLLKSFKKIDYWYQKQGDTTIDIDIRLRSLRNANDVFANKLRYYTEKFPVTMTYPFYALKKEHLDISTSADSFFRIYSWDTWMGGTMYFFESLMQYKTGAGYKSIIDTPKSEGDVRPNYKKMGTLTINGKAFYVCTYMFIFSTKDVADGIHIFTIDGGKLIDAPIIKTNSGLHSDLAYDYDFWSVVNIAYEKRPRPRFDRKTKIIYLPLVDGNNQMTNKFILYKFTGQYFERVKN